MVSVVTDHCGLNIVAYDMCRCVGDAEEEISVKKISLHILQVITHVAGYFWGPTKADI